jgi:phenylalanyl-tRNA synthetase beta chain
MGLAPADERRNVVKIANPLTEDQAVMRTTMIYSLLETMRKNANVGSFNLKLFELGRIYLHRQAGAQPEEQMRLACLLTGVRYDDSWHFKDVPGDFYDLKGLVENIFEDLKIKTVRYLPDAQEPFLHPGRSCCLMLEDRPIGYLGEVHPDVLAALDLKNPATVCDLDMERLRSIYQRETTYKELSRYPSSTRDVAFLVDRQTPSEAIVSAVMKADEELLEKVSIFDVYEGEGIAEGKKSLALRFCYRSLDRTLTDDEVNQVHAGMVTAVVALTGARVRGV